MLLLAFNAAVEGYMALFAHKLVRLLQQNRQHIHECNVVTVTLGIQILQMPYLIVVLFFTCSKC